MQDFPPVPSSAAGPVQPVRLNIFALPSRTTLLFLLIVIVIYIPLFATLPGNSAVCAPMLLFWMVVLPLRYFWRRPGRVIEADHLTDAQADNPTLTLHLGELAQGTAHLAPPHLFLAPAGADVAWTFGTFRRSYLVLSNAMAREWQRARSEGGKALEYVHAIALHELAHFRHNDVWLAELSRSVLLVTIGFMILSLLVHWTTPFLYYGFLRFYDLSQPPWSEVIGLLARSDPKILEVVDPQNPIVARRWAEYEVFITLAFAPLIGGSFLLLLFFWRALLRTRELYADARVVAWQKGDASLLWGGVLVAGTLQGFRSGGTGWRAVLVHSRAAVMSWFDERVGVRKRFGRLAVWLPTHPNQARRKACLDAPYQVYGGNLSIALTAGAAVVLLNLNLSSLFYSRSLRGPNSVPPFALGFIIIALSLLPYLCQYPGPLRGLFGKVAKIVLLFTAIKLLPQYMLALFVGFGLLLYPDLLQRALETFVHGDLPADFVDPELQALFLRNFIYAPAVLFTFFMPIFLIGYVLLDLGLKRRMLHWYGWGMFERHSSVIFSALTGALTLLLIFVILPIVDWITIPTAHDPLEPVVLVPLGVVAVLSVALGLLFVYLDRRYARRCPRCGDHVESTYALGVHCEHCHAVLNPWLVANESG